MTIQKIGSQIDVDMFIPMLRYLQTSFYGAKLLVNNNDVLTPKGISVMKSIEKSSKAALLLTT